MLTSLLPPPSHATCSYEFAWCSMKSIGRVSHAVYQAALQAASDLIIEKLKNGSYVPFPYQTTRGRNITLKRSKTEIWAISSPNQSQRLNIILSRYISQFLSSISYLSKTHKCFLHACTPERRTRALAHLFNQCTHVGGQHTKKHILQKNVQVPETVGNETSGGASKPHRSKYMPVCMSVLLFIPDFRR